MEKCPKCKETSLVFDPRLKCACCLNMDCDYRKSMSDVEYSERFERESKNVAHKLFLYRYGRVGISVYDEGKQVKEEHNNT